MIILQSLHDELMRQQESFDNLAEQAQILMQSSTDSRVSTQLTQMSTRYSALITVSKVCFWTIILMVVLCFNNGLNLQKVIDIFRLAY